MAIVTGTLFIVSAPSGAGKTSLVRALAQSDPLVHVSVSHTTRTARSSEVQGKNYHFVDTPTFEQLLAAGLFLEHAQVFGHYYGTSRDKVEQHLAQGLDVILEIDWQGAQQVRKLMPVKSIFILPPSKQALIDRLTYRAQDKPEVIAQRMALASEETSHYCEFDYLIINDDFDQAVIDLKAILLANRRQQAKQALVYGDLIKSLL
jgi:guanylate kinase